MKKGICGKILTVLAVFAAVFLLAAAMHRLDAGRETTGREQLEDTIRRAVVACYAAEGFYPPSLDYLRQHYGLQIDETRYSVFYEVFGENLMPEITVLLKE